ncbi:MAG: Rieske 2Fe-2S domain-containing protein [Nitrospira sp.]|nr:Rieske 2Fe-2S domain-containing protein [Nitrospira sp.]
METDDSLTKQPDFVTVAKKDDLQPGTGRIVEVHGIWIALFNVDGTFYAIDNTCPHAGGPLGEGRLDGTIVECPWHGWKFDVASGERVGNPNFQVACCTVRVQGDEVQIAVPPALMGPA